jgi:5-formyltetrahydrofolate cyclo-ligase
VARTRKAALRAELLAVLDGISDSDRRRQENEAASRLVREACWREARWLFAYLPMPREFNIEPLLKEALAEGRRLALPRIAGKEMFFHQVPDLAREWVLHPFGMREPDPRLPGIGPEELPHGEVLVLVPGLGFGPDGSRLGYGGGFYDRFLSRLPEGVRTASLVYRQQLIRDIPMTDRDMWVGLVVSA